MSNNINSTVRLMARRIKKTVAPFERAQEALGDLTHGVHLFGFTKGQFSLIDLIKAVLNQIGSADLILSTWTTGIRDAENIDFLVTKGDLRSVLLLTDRSFPTRQPQYCKRILEIFGEGAIRCTRTHAKFALIQNERWNIAIRSSMNLNRNPRFEQFDLSDDSELCAFIRRHVDEIFATMSEGFDFSTAECDAVFSQALEQDNGHGKHRERASDKNNSGAQGDDFESVARW